MKDIITPEELFELHEALAVSTLIRPEKKQKLDELLKNYSEVLYAKMASKENEVNTVCSLYYTSEIRGFTLKVKTGLGVIPEIEFDEIYFGQKNAISPIMPNSAQTRETDVMIRWLNKDIRQYLFKQGWQVAIINSKDKYNEKILIYAENKTFK